MIIIALYIVLYKLFKIVIFIYFKIQKKNFFEEYNFIHKWAEFNIWMGEEIVISLRNSMNEAFIVKIYNFI